MARIPDALRSARTIRVAIVSFVVFGSFWGTSMYLLSRPVCQWSPEHPWGCLGLGLLMLFLIHPLTVVVVACSMAGRGLVTCAYGAIVTGFAGWFLFAHTDQLLDDPPWPVGGLVVTLCFVLPAVGWTALSDRARC